MIIEKALNIPKFKAKGFNYFPAKKNNELFILEQNTTTEQYREIDLFDFLGNYCGISADEFSEEVEDQTNVHNILQWDEKITIIKQIKLHY